MKTIKEIIKNRKYPLLWVVLVLVVSFFLGYLFSSIVVSNKEPESTEKKIEKEQEQEQEQEMEWTCSMHPEIRRDKPGKCPICGMDLIPIKKGVRLSENPNALSLSKEAMAIANIETSVVYKSKALKEIHLYGKIVADERNFQSQAAHVDGRIESLGVNFTGETVQKGQSLVKLYSPELFTAQQELIEAMKMENNSLVNAARKKLRLWKITEEQIEEIEKRGESSPYIEIKSSTSGIVLSKNISVGDYIAKGTVLFDIANLSKVWALFEAFETDLPFLKIGEQLVFRLQALPGKYFEGVISFIDPIVNAITRTTGVRVDVKNEAMDLKPGMFATADISSKLKEGEEHVIIPSSALLWTGKRAIVYVKLPKEKEPTFVMREIELGAYLGDDYVVLSGLEEGEEIVTRGTFVVDASAQLEGKRSMMNNENEEKHKEKVHAADKVTEKQAVMEVNGVCEMCKQRIEKAAKGVAGVKTATWDLKTKKLSLTYDSKKLSPETISKVIAGVGHDTEYDTASDDVYDKLPNCCKYR